MIKTENPYEIEGVDDVISRSECKPDCTGVDAINPNHYKQGSIEVIDFILDQKMSYLEGNIIKYVSRYKFKNGIEDLEKARWYLEKLYVLKLNEGNREDERED